MKYEEVGKELFLEFKPFTVDEGDLDLQYIIAGYFTDFILDAYQTGDKNTYQKGLQFIERLHLDETQKVRELATVGYLESIQNTWPTELLESNIPFNDLGSESKKWWNELNSFWDGKIKYLGETINTYE